MTEEIVKSRQKKYVCPPNPMLPPNFGEPLSGERNRAGVTKVIFFMFRKLKFRKIENSENIDKFEMSVSK